MTVSRTGTNPTPFGFVGKEQYQSDSDSGLQLLGHRYYDSSIGRFLSQDPIQDGENWYAYADNNPLGATDPTGLKPPQGKTPPKGSPKPKMPWEKTYRTMDDAARAILGYIMPQSLRDNHEWGGAIIRVPGGFRPTRPTIIDIGTSGSGEGFVAHPPDTAGDYHTHPGNQAHTSDDGDQYDSDISGLPGYAGDHTGGIWRNDPQIWHVPFGYLNTPPDDPHNPRTGDGAVRLPKGWK